MKSILLNNSDSAAEHTSDEPLPFTPLQDHVLLDPLPLDEVTIGGLLLPEDRVKFEFRGRVLAVGPGAYLAAGGRSVSMLKPGDVVICNPMKVLTLGDFSRHKYGLVSEQHIYAKDNR